MTTQNDNHDALFSLYSDMYKDRNGIRPRWAAAWSVAELEAGIARLDAEPLEDLDDSYAEDDRVPTSGDGWVFVPAVVT